MHFSNACHKWGKGSDDRDETGKDDGFLSMFFIEALGFEKVFLLDIFFLFYFFPKVFSDAVIYCVTENSCCCEDDEKKNDLERA